MSTNPTNHPIAAVVNTADPSPEVQAWLSTRAKKAAAARHEKYQTHHSEPPAQEMSAEMEARAMQHIESMLRGMGAQFAILLPNGHVYGELPIAPPDNGARKGKQFRYSPGTFMRVYEPHLKDLKVGEVAKVPYGEYPPESIRSAMAAYACNHWGNKSAITNIDKASLVVELMRMQ